MSHVFAPEILRAYDVRGTFGATLHEADGVALGRSFGTIVRRAGGRRVAVGRDGRRSSPVLEAALVAGLRAAGVHVVRIGVGPSPMLYFAERTLGVDAGIQVTGSHNPRDHNGFKLVHRGRPFFGAAIGEMAALAAAGDWESGAGGVEDADVLDAYVADLARDAAGLRPFRVGWDAGNGAAGPAMALLTALLPGEHHLLHAEVDGDFPNHHPDPTVEANLADLRRLVAEKGLDFGVAFDGDGDRIGAIDGAGRIVAGDQLLSILAQPVLEDVPGAAIVADVKASHALFDRIAALGGRPVMWKSGHSNIKAMMLEVGAPVAGEMSGHIFFAELGGHDDALYAAVRLIAAIGRAGKSLAALRDALPATVSTPELRFAVPEERKAQVVDEVLARLADAGARVDRTDGARVSTADGWWLLRASNTEAALTVRAEAHDAAGLERLVASLDAALAASGIARKG